MSDLPKEKGCDKFSNGSILIFQKDRKEKMSKEPKITNMWKILKAPVLFPIRSQRKSA